MMRPAVRIYDGRVCRKYRPYVFIAAIILFFQLLLAYSIYKVNTGDDLSFKESFRYEETLIQQGHEGDVVVEETVPRTAAAEDQNASHRSKVRKGAVEVVRTAPVGSFVTVKLVNFSSAAVQIQSEQKYVLNMSELSFVPACDIVSKDAVSAIQRAKTQSCKHEIADLVCLSNNEKLYPQRLPRYCPSKGRLTGEYIACYRDNRTQRILNDQFSKLSNNTPSLCVDQCLQYGYYLAGVEYGSECFCGNQYPSFKLQLSESDCDTKCPGDGNKFCGGYYTMNVYSTGISQAPKTNSELKTTSNPTIESAARVVYLLTLNGRGVRQVRRLIKTLYHTDSYFFIHVDSRQDYMYRELLPLESKFSNIRLSRWRLSTIWGGASLLQMMLHCMKEVLNIAEWHWDFFINLSESDFPIKTHAELVTFLTDNKGKNFIKSHGKDTQKFMMKQGLDKTFHECDHHMYRIGNRKFPFGVHVDGGSDWVAISRDFANYTVNEQNELISGLKTIYKQTLLPAESFFHTLLRNSEHCDTFVDNNLHVTNWKRKIGCRCQYKHIVDWCGCSPNVFKPEDWSRIRMADSRPYFFARKFEPLINQAIIDQLERWLYGPPRDGSAIELLNIVNRLRVVVEISCRSLDATDLAATSYWQNEFHFNDSSPVVDGAFYTAYQSFSRLSVNLLDDLAKKCKLSVGRVLEATLYSENDLYTGTLMLFETVAGDPHFETVLLETQVRPRQFFEVMRTVGPAGRLKYFQVGTLFDQKEQLFRNFGQIMGPNSEISLLHKWSEGETFSAVFVWIDPTHTVAGSFEIKVNSSSILDFHKPQFLLPLRPGTWTVKLMYNWKTFAETKFLVIPLSHEGMQEIDKEQAKLINGGSGKKRYIDKDFTNVEKLLAYDDIEAKVREADEKGNLYGTNLTDWIDSLITQFYTIQDTCYVQTVFKPSQSLPCTSTLLESCREVPWSSRYPDRKSFIGEVNIASGRLER